MSVWLILLVACYVTALGLELSGLRRRFAQHRAALALVTLAGLAAHGIHLVGQTAASDVMPLASPAEWLLVAAWVMALIYLAAIFYLRETACGLLMLPLVLALVAASAGASHEPFAAERTFWFWGMVHGLLLLLGTVAVCVGFLAGLTYLLQSYALKHAQFPAGGLRLPSLEWLQWTNSRALAISTLLIALGFFSGVVLSMVAHRGDTAWALWTDPVVLSSAAMLLWLVAAEAFRLLYPAARQGRKVAYLTLASFVFLVITLASLTLVESGHGV